MSKIQMTDDDLDSVAGESSTYVEANAKAPTFPITFLEDVGVYTFKIWPDLNPKTQKPRVMREVWINKIPRYEGDKIVTGETILYDDDLETVYEKALDEGLNVIRRFKAAELGFLMTQMVSVTFPDGKVSDYCKSGMDVLLVLRSWPTQEILAFREFLASLTREERRSLFDTEKPSAVVKAVVSKSDANNIYSRSVKFSLDLTVGYTLKDMKLPEGIEWVNLDEVYVKANQTITPEQRQKVTTVLSRMRVEARQAESRGISDPVKGTSNALAERISSTKPPAQTSTSKTSMVTGSAEDDDGTPECHGGKCILKVKCNRDPEYRGLYGAYGYGKHPDETTAECITCDIEMACITATSTGE